MITLSAQGRRLLGLLYVAALVILVDQSLDLVTSILPFRPNAVAWRFGSFGLGMARLEFIALADAMAVATAIYLNHRRILVFLGVVHLILGFFLLAGTALFILDGLQVRRTIRVERVREVDVAAIKTLLLAGSACLASLALSFMVWRTRQIQAKVAESSKGMLVASPRTSSRE